MVIVVVLSLLAASASAGLALVSQTERQIATRHRSASVLASAAESALTQVVAALDTQATWASVPGLWTAGPVVVTPDVERQTEALNRSLAARLPAGDDTPRWRVIATGSQDAMPTVAWVRDDPADDDGDPAVDGNGRVTVRAEAQAVRGERRAFEATVQRGVDGVTLVAWREVW